MNAHCPAAMKADWSAKEDTKKAQPRMKSRRYLVR
jgi:hypothetical protein